MGKKKGASGLGRCLIKQKPTSRLYDSSLHTTELNDGYDWGRANVTSITEQNDLDAFLATAELAGIDFTAEKQNVKVVHKGDVVSSGVLSDGQKAALKNLHEEHKELLRIPRRPPWNSDTSAEELHALERESFVSWRRQLAEHPMAGEEKPPRPSIEIYWVYQGAMGLLVLRTAPKPAGKCVRPDLGLQEVEGIILTPYEKNLEFWRQLWRVVERRVKKGKAARQSFPSSTISEADGALCRCSDVVVQIVDARNPLLFHCGDLERYVMELDPLKQNLLILNKADYLNRKQRVSHVDARALRARLAGVGRDADRVTALGETKLLKKTMRQSNSGTQSENRFEDPSRLYTKEELLELFRTTHPHSKATKGQTVVGLVGYPNVGKSSTINALLSHKKVSVSTTPGKTKHFQTLQLEEGLWLCDCPGLVFPNFVSSKAEMIVHGILPIDQMTDHVPPVSLISFSGRLIPRHVLEATYGIMIPRPHETEDPDRAPTSEELLNAYGYMRGYMTQSGVPDNPRASRYVLRDFVTGRLLYCMAPPGVKQDDYHQFPPPTKASRPEPAQANRARERRVTSKDIDRDFFQKKAPEAHIKGRTVVATGSSDAGASSEGKPWKKHHNAKKKEKLRRVYASHDL
ncbi:hypothetical protein HPB47_013043 [Ixodes persulcatus]|uniref:Uncharacterized protein n=1 Tax=Ixodes persulcatus TaxID=34615 RepID=A0AC60NRT9_IXOPE|nr:hypothetical protein HPB47_013043 [Ixodes persulcatus]